MKAIATTLLIFGLALPLAAQGRRMDADHDGKISREEWKGRSEVFNRLDRDNNGFITKDELQQMRRNLGQALKNMDSDKDGKISMQEWQGPAEAFNRLDSNNDGFLTRDELRQNRQNRQGRRGGQQR
jgi:Ca2+-binding EF-hand superfamily protein